MLKPVLCLLLSALVIAVMCESAFAQLQPRINPWMGMTDRTRHTGPLGPYFTNVRPQQEIMRAYSSQQSQIHSQEQALRALQRSSGDSASSSAPPLSAPPGRGVPSVRLPDTLNPPREIPRANKNPAGFNQYLHYYPPHSMPRRQVPRFSPVP